MDLDFIGFKDNDCLGQQREKDPNKSSGGSLWREEDLRDGAAAPLVRLHNEMLNLVALESPGKEEKTTRKAVRLELTALIQEVFPTAKVEVFGSEATGILTRSSDLDLAVTIPPPSSSSIEYGEGSVDEEVMDGDKMRLKICSRLQRARVCSYLEIINARVPIVKLDHAASGLGVDICVNNNSGVMAARLIRKYCSEYPVLRPLGIVLKVFLSQRALNDTFTGGVGSFVMCCMLISFLQREDAEMKRRGFESTRNLGALLLDFFDLYGSRFNYVETGIVLDGTYFSKRERGADWFDSSRPFLLSIENPFEQGADMGKNSYLISRVRKAFEHGKQVLQAVIVREAESPGRCLLGLVINVEHSGASRFSLEEGEVLPSAELRGNKRKRGRAEETLKSHKKKNRTKEKTRDREEEKGKTKEERRKEAKRARRSRKEMRKKEGKRRVTI